jgi:hypothetical protein
LADPLGRDPQFNDRRLVTRRKLGAIAQQFLERWKSSVHAREGMAPLMARTSLHQPHAFNHMKVSRQWAYLCRGKQEKARLKRTIGAELAKDLDAAYRNAYLCVAVEAEALEVSLRIHPEAWYDGQNLLHRCQRTGVDLWLELLRAQAGFRLQLDNWKGEWPCERMDRDRWSEFARFYRPGELGLAVQQRLSAPRAARGPALDPHLPQRLVAALEGLVPLYRFAAWSAESDFLLSK